LKKTENPLETIMNSLKERFAAKKAAKKQKNIAQSLK
jgi:hypothetical protein